MSPHEVLGVAPNASEEEVKAAYRKLSMLTHPDRNVGDKEAEERFKQVQAAYEAITNPPARPNFNPFDVNSVFDQFFNMHTRRQAPRGRDIHSSCTVSFMEAALGCEVVVTVRLGDRCQKCDGSGATEVTTCHVCLGQGVVGYQQGQVSVTTTCNNCSGLGKVAKGACGECGGDGIVKDTVPVTVKVPAGIRDGDHIRLPGRGERVDRPGDAYVRVQVLPHPLFRREGDDLTFSVPISYGQAVFGCKVDVPTLEGVRTIDVHPESKSGSEVRIVGGGLVGPRGWRGDCVIRVEVDTSMPSDAGTKNKIRKLMKSEKPSDAKRLFQEQLEKFKKN